MFRVFGLLLLLGGGGGAFYYASMTTSVPVPRVTIMPGLVVGGEGQRVENIGLANQKQSGTTLCVGLLLCGVVLLVAGEAMAAAGKSAEPKEARLTAEEWTQQQRRQSENIAREMSKQDKAED
jgi:hypothetical protein